MFLLFLNQRDFFRCFYINVFVWFLNVFDIIQRVCIPCVKMNVLGLCSALASRLSF